MPQHLLVSKATINTIAMRQSHVYYPKQLVGNHNEYAPDTLSIAPYDN
jgi:hypothetical protein